jgi:hypothetical protein
MKLLISRLAVAVAGASMAFAPISATAATRAADNTTVYQASAAVPGTGRAAKGEKLVSPGILLAVFAGAAIIAGIVIAADDGDDNQSPGAN